MKLESQEDNTGHDALIRRALAHIPSGSVIVFDKNLRYLFAAGRGWEFAGVNPDEITGKTPAEVFSPEMVEYVSPYYRQVLQGQDVEFDLLINERWYTFNAAPVFDQRGEVEAIIAVAINCDERRRAKAELAANEVRFRTVFESVQDAILISDNSGAYTEANPAACEILGRSRAGIINRSARDFVSAEMQHAVAAMRAECMRAGRQSGELEILRPDGSRRVVEVNAVANFLPGSHVSVLRDITERKAAERTQSYFASIIESTDDAIIGTSLDGVITSWNDGARRMLDYTADEMIGQSFEILVPATNLEESRQLKADQIASGQNRLIEKPLVRKDGAQVEASIQSTIVRNAAGEPLGVFVIARDITQRKRAEAEQALLANIVENSTEAIVSKTLEGLITTWNRGAEQIYGYTAQEAIGRHMSMLHPPDRLNEEFEILAKLQRGERILPFETKRLRKNGRIIDVSISSNPILNAAGEVVGASNIARDISESKKMQAALERANEALEERVSERTAELSQANQNLVAEVKQRKMAMGALHEAIAAHQQAKEEAERANLAKSEFLSRMSHELRTPMNAILGFGQILEMRDLAPKDSVGVQQILKAGRHLLQLINEVLEITRIEAGGLSLSMEPVEVSPLLHEALELVQPLADQRNIALLNEAASATSGGGYVLADRQRLRQVLLNLLSNAIKYNREGGDVILLLREVSGSEASQPNCLRIAVRDTGPGIAIEDQEKIFVPFERLGAEKTSTEGTGIGLPLAQRLTELMHGQLGVESQPGQGSTFWIELPITESPAQSLQSTRAESSFLRRFAVICQQADDVSLYRGQCFQFERDGTSAARDATSSFVECHSGQYRLGFGTSAST